MWLELAANAFMAVSVLLAGRNSIHTWWTGILGCLLFAQVFREARLYADVTLQFFFLTTSVLGWWRWRRHDAVPVSSLARGERIQLLLAAALGVLAAGAYGGFLVAFTKAAAPYADSLVLMFSVIAQLLLMRRRVEAWWFWIVVNTVAVPLFASRGLWITSVLYVAYWINAVVALRHWRALARGSA